MEVHDPTPSVRPRRVARRPGAGRRGPGRLDRSSARRARTGEDGTGCCGGRHRGVGGLPLRSWDGSAWGSPSPSPRCSSPLSRGQAAPSWDDWLRPWRRRASGRSSTAASGSDSSAGAVGTTLVLPAVALAAPGAPTLAARPTDHPCLCGGPCWTARPSRWTSLRGRGRVAATRDRQDCGRLATWFVPGTPCGASRPTTCPWRQPDRRRRSVAALVARQPRRSSDLTRVYPTGSCYVSPASRRDCVPGGAAARPAPLPGPRPGGAVGRAPRCRRPTDPSPAGCPGDPGDVAARVAHAQWCPGHTLSQRPAAATRSPRRRRRLGPVPTPRDALPAPAPWAARLVQGIAEVLSLDGPSPSSSAGRPPTSTMSCGDASTSDVVAGHGSRPGARPTPHGPVGARHGAVGRGRR